MPTSGVAGKIIRIKISREIRVGAEFSERNVKIECVFFKLKTEFMEKVLPATLCTTVTFLFWRNGICSVNLGEKEEMVIEFNSTLLVFSS